MLIRRLTATFGTLDNRSLDLKDGLNILEAPNEAGKSTWCAFLLAMLYGLNTRERDRGNYPAEKNRYAPWNGAPMRGSMDCLALGRELTLTRETVRPAAPMGEFSAVRAGGGGPVPELEGRTCGETLLGVTREVYERSAFIRQAGLPISGDAGLERRIAALISSGEEDVSYMEAAESLKKALNRRRCGPSGQIPALEQDLRDAEEQLGGAEDLAGALSAARERVEELARQEAALLSELAEIERWEADQARREAEGAVAKAEEQAAFLRRTLAEEHVPNSDTLARLRAAVVNQLLNRNNMKHAEKEKDDAEWVMEQAEAAMLRSPFAGKSPAEALDAEPDLPPRPRFPQPLALLLFLLSLAAGNLTYRLSGALSPGAPSFPAALAGTVLSLSLMAGGAAWVIRQRRQSWEGMAAKRRKKWDADREKYLSLYRASGEAQKKAGEAQGVMDAYETAEKALLREIRSFSPGVYSLTDADERLRECARRRKELNAAEAAAREAAIRRDVFREREHTPAALPAEDGGITVEDGPVPEREPARTREAVSLELGGVRGELAAARSDADRAAGQLLSAGDLVVLRTAASHTRDEIAVLEEEFEALQLAMAAMSHANAILQSRFSPALGKRAGEIFNALTEGKYDAVTLDRAFNFSAGADGVFHSASVLSSGCADQLYLAARLAICEMVLPEDQSAPIVLDDALANFDDRRCRAALRFLKAEAKKRQILLFTCHNREAAFLSRDKSVYIQRLTREQ